MAAWQGILTSLIICVPLLLTKVLKDEAQKSTYFMGYIIGVLITVKLMGWFG